MKKYILSIIIVILSFTSEAFGQIDEIKDKARKDKNNERSSDSDNYYYQDDDETFGEALAGEACGCIGNIFLFLFWEAIEAVQSSALEQKEEYPYVSSIELKLWGGFSQEKKTLFVSPNLQGNWGIFSTDFRYTYLEEVSASLQNLDWQIIKLNIPVKTFKASAGLGFTYLTDPGISYLEYTFGSELHLLKNKLVLAGEYRGTSENENSEVFRKEYNFQVDYNTSSFGRFHLSPMLGIRYQTYYNSYHYFIFNFGIAFRFY
jgi:hypothetical protein